MGSIMEYMYVITREYTDNNFKMQDRHPLAVADNYETATAYLVDYTQYIIENGHHWFNGNDQLVRRIVHDVYYIETIDDDTAIIFTIHKVPKLNTIKDKTCYEECVSKNMVKTL